jgi:hypothetical protein
MNQNSKNIKIILLFTISILALKSYGQNVNDTPLINHIYSSNRLSQEPENIYIKRTAEFIGIKITYSLKDWGYSSDSDGYWTKSKSLKAVKAHLIKSIDSLNKEFPKSYIYFSNTGLVKEEYIDPINLAFITIYANFYLDVYFLIETDTTKTEKELFNESSKIADILKSNAIPTEPYGNENRNKFRLKIDKYPILAIKDKATYNEILLKKIITKINMISNSLDEQQNFEIEINQKTNVQRASMFNLFFIKQYNLNLKSSK